MRASLFLSSAVGLIAMAASTAAFAQPSRLILMRHAEKHDAYALCEMGALRAEALAKQFLGRGAAPSLFGPGEKPEAFLAITLHPIETITPAAQSWSLPVTAYTVVPGEDEDDSAKEIDINKRTQEAARDVMSQSRYDGKIVVMTWEHKHIAKSKLEKAYPGEEVTLRQLFHLDQVAGAPKTWPDANYDFFWIVDFAPRNPVPVGFRMVRQAFTAPFDKLPANEWEEPEPLHMEAGCLK